MDIEDRRPEPDHDDSRAAEPPAEGADKGHSPGSGDASSCEEPGPLGNPEQAGFDAVNVSDHLQPWWEPGEDDDAALEGARVWKGTQPPEFYVDDWSDPVEMQRKAADEISDEEFKQSYIVSSDPAVHVERIREIEAMGATVVCLQNASGADPLGAIETYREHVLPALRRS